MDLAAWVNLVGDDTALAIGGFAVGATFGAAAQQSRFCLRAAVIEFSKATLGEKAAIWAVAFACAVTFTQGLIVAGLLDVGEARQLAARGSMSGAIIGGLMFGCGMILARGCASRLLVLSGTGNLRALVSGLILTLVAQASLRGVLSPARETLSALWMVEGGKSRDLLSLVGGGAWLGLMLGLSWLGVAVWLVKRNGVEPRRVIGAALVGAMIAGGWYLTYALFERRLHPSCDQERQFLRSFCRHADGADQFAGAEARLRYRSGAGCVLRFDGSGDDHPRDEDRELFGRLVHDPLHRRRIADGIRQHAGRWLRGGRRRYRRRHLRNYRLGRVDRDVAFGGRHRSHRRDHLTCRLTYRRRCLAALSGTQTSVLRARFQSARWRARLGQNRPGGAET